ncbi:hypothetical protein P389DRAFT_4835 [Cystobasidium minutum MCA 4210]|uniref:uncharacterized protein n=1 Tax=Cystobasidium minutum MCA 4210 TaxID=1397322 RepID=UPI0034CE0FB7|eukprot:jgi/Rhomi1/4835/CE4834_53
MGGFRNRLAERLDIFEQSAFWRMKSAYRSISITSRHYAPRPLDIFMFHCLLAIACCLYVAGRLGSSFVRDSVYPGEPWPEGFACTEI